MIATAKGTVTDKNEKSLVLDIHGIGLEIFVSQLILGEAEIGKELMLFTHFNVKEDALQLYGFAKAEQRNFFRQLITVSGVGPKMAMEMLEIPLDNIRKAIIEKNVGFMTQIKGLGKKTAQKVIVDLESKLSADDIRSSVGISGFFSEELIFALQNLGFRRKDIFQRLQDLPDNISETGDVIRWFLKTHK